MSICVSDFRFGSRIDALSGRKGRRPLMFSVHRVPCSQHRACHSFLPLPPWRTACAPSTPTTLAGLRGWRGSPSCSSPPLWVASQAWRSHCHSAALVQARHQTPWVSLTACPPTAPVCSPTSTRRLFQECRPPSPALRTYRAPHSCVAPRTVTCGEERASRLWGAKRWSTQCPWVSLSDFWPHRTLFHQTPLSQPRLAPSFFLFLIQLFRSKWENEWSNQALNVRREKKR